MAIARSGDSISFLQEEFPNNETLSSHVTSIDCFTVISIDRRGCRSRLLILTANRSLLRAAIDLFCYRVALPQNTGRGQWLERSAFQHRGKCVVFQPQQFSHNLQPLTQKSWRWKSLGHIDTRKSIDVRSASERRAVYGLFSEEGRKEGRKEREGKKEGRKVRRQCKVESLRVAWCRSTWVPYGDTTTKWHLAAWKNYL